MKRVLCVRFPNWPIQRLLHELLPSVPAALAIHSPHADPRPNRPKTTDLVEHDFRYVRTLFPAARNGPAVMAVSESAWGQGVRPGLPLAEARSMVAPAGKPSSKPTAMAATAFHEWHPGNDRTQLTELAEALRRFAPVVGIDEMPVPDCLLLDVTGCGSLFGGESVLAEALLREVQQIGFHARVCISDTVASSWAFTHADGHSVVSRKSGPATGSSRQDQYSQLPVLIVPPAQQLDYAASLPIATARLSLQDLAVLSQLGLRTIGQLLNLPREDLPSRLTANASLRIRQLLSIDTEVIQPLPETDPVAAEWKSEIPVTKHQELRQVIDCLVERIVTHLVRRKLGCTRLICELSGQNTNTAIITAEVVRAVQSQQLLSDVLSLRLQSWPFQSPVDCVQLKADVSPLPVSRQKDLFSASEHIVPQEELATLINRLSGRLGPAAVLRAQPCADARPEHAVKLSPVVDASSNNAAVDSSESVLFNLVTPAADASGARPLGAARPLRLLPVPIDIDMPGDQSDPTNATFTWNGRRCVIHAASGPERLQTAWWTEHSVHRDYYVVSTGSHSRFWIYRDLQAGRWLLHGIFD
jgi:protein ImuB